MKKTLCFLTAFICFLSLLPSAVFASSAGGRVVRVGFFAFDGYHIQDENGRRSGYGYDFLQELARYGDWTYEYDGYDKSWSEMQDMLENGQIDLLTSAQKTPEREEKFAFSDEAIGTSSAILTVKSGDSRYTIGDYSTYSGMRIGLIRDNSRNEKLADFAAEKGFSYTPVYYTSVSEMAADLQTGRNIDAICSSNLRSIHGEWILDEFNPSDFYVMVRKNDTDLLAKINHAISMMDSNQTDWRHRLWDKYYTADASGEIAYSADEKAFIREMQDSGTSIRAVVEPDQAPYSYFENGTAKGIIPDLFTRAAEMTGLNFEIVETKNREDYFSLLNSGSGIDVRIDAYDDYFDAEQKGFKLTSAYLTASVSTVTRRSVSEPYASAAVVKTADSTPCRTDLLNSGSEILQFDTVRECLDAVKNGKAAVTCVLSYTAQQYLNTNDLTGTMQSVILPQYSVPFAIGVSNQADYRLMTILDKAVTNLSDDTVESVILTHTENEKSDLTIWQFFVMNPLLLFIAAAVFTILAVLIVALIYRQKNLQLIEIKNRELQAEALRADQASEAKSQFLSSMSHDMRTPLNGVISFTDFALKADSKEKKQEYIEKTRRSAKILMSLINDTLEVSRIESGKMELHPEWTDFKELISGISLVIENSAAEKNISFTEYDNLPEKELVLTDKLKIQDLMMNLLSNAVKYTPDGGSVHFSVTENTESDGRKNAVITVCDSGIGISKEFLPNLFEPFAQERDPSMKGVGGTGLGLYIVHRIVALLKGTIRVETEKGSGTKFTVSLPIEAGKGPDRGAPETAADYDFSGKKVLLCEDNFINTEIARTILSEKGILVTCAENGKEGVETFSASAEGEFDAILMDIHMPVLDGYRATGEIRALNRPDAASVPIIAMTADAYEEDISRCLAAGMNGHTTKPVDPDHLFAELGKFMHASLK
ncbi:MAG: transporter substrate-binding domain-containing protein [Lachnospiraceae bacterium]|jgi:signal transduction histidine kinase|nr:transporter substrate-binding domain-containing protein [Lachnospiraceae bacterium]MCI1727007.1 transporter substrate-binding domain-containing protein [Lachnospiraceae bacterium]